MPADPRRVCLIVDHPTRDLDGLTLVAAELAHRGVEVFLVPMYEAKEVFSLAPDVVLVNYVRFANSGFVRACRRLGIAVGVLDTEGGVRQDLDEYARQVAPYAEHLQLYCVWGRAQYAALDSGAGLAAGALRATGCPRYDWSVAPLREAISPPVGVSDPMILVNTNFPILRPRFQSREREIEDLVRMGYAREAVDACLEQSERARAGVIAATIALADALPSVQIVLRPHPFEDQRTYEQALEHCGNARVEHSGPVFQWIRHSRLMVHFNCSTAIDSMLLGVEPVHLDWIDAPLLSQPTVASVSSNAASVGDLIALAKRAVRGEAIPASAELLAARRQVVDSYFYADDGRATARVADAVTDLMSRNGGRPETGFGYAARVFRAQGSVAAAAKYGLSAIGGAGVLDGLRRQFRRSTGADAKRFSVEDVAAIMQRLARVSPTLRELSVATALPRHGSMPHLTGLRSIRIAPPSVAARAVG